MTTGGGAIDGCGFAVEDEVVYVLRAAHDFDDDTLQERHSQDIRLFNGGLVVSPTVLVSDPGE